jgi:hypothetical protein
MSRKQIDYKILVMPACDLKRGLEGDVRDSMKHGWEVLGAPFCGKYDLLKDSEDCIFQAMVKYDQPTQNNPT